MVPVKTQLAGPAQMLRNRAHKPSIEIEVTQPAILAVTHQQQGLVIARIHRQAMVTVEHAFRIALACKDRLVIPFLVKLEEPRISITIGYEDGAVGARYCRRKPPLIRSEEHTSE